MKSYHTDFTDELNAGLRLEGWSIDEVCKHWGIDTDTYDEWLEKYPEFYEAHKAGERDQRIFWAERLRNNSNNAQVLKMAATHFLGVTDKNIDKHEAEPIGRIEFVVKPIPKRAKSIEDALKD